MTKTMTASAAYTEVLEAVEAIKNEEHATIATMSQGDVLRQGDLYVLCLDKPIPGKSSPTPTRQLAPGTSQGSRHVAEGDCDVLIVDEEEAVKMVNRLVPATKKQEGPMFIGPMIVARGLVTIGHPEHGDRTLPGDSCYLVVYQRAYADTIRRTQD